MKFSRNWLQTYIVESLPEDAVIKDVLNKKAFEVEEVILLPHDTVFDIKVLPNRAHDALGHRGMAKELCADFGFAFKEDVRITREGLSFDGAISAPLIAIEDEDACMRFAGLRIDGIHTKESPEWLKEQLNAIGQKSINAIVDITNYVQFSVNKPMHAYDAASIEGTLRARFAREGEVLTTLDEKQLNLDEETLVIADDKKVLGLAGIKGGKFSGVHAGTTSIILESANFNATLIRKTSQKYDLKTDASKRFENGIANCLVEEGLYLTAHLIKELCPEASISAVVDVYPHKDDDVTLPVLLSDINNILGTTYSSQEVEDTLHALSFSFTKNGEEFMVNVPAERLDIRIKEDIAEEIGRIIGYDKLTPVIPKLDRAGLPHKRMYYENKIRTGLIDLGFSEVMTYTFGDTGKVELVKGLAADKEKLRASLSEGIAQALLLNIYNAPLLGEKSIKIFEFGNVFTKESETKHLAFGIDDGSKKGNFEELGNKVLAEIKNVLGVEDVAAITVSHKPYIVEINFDTLIAQLPDPTTYEAPSFAHLPVVNYTPVSPYPFIARDIAMWVPDSVTWEDIRADVIKVHNTLVTRVDLFDTFQKEVDGHKRTSFAFRLIFQSYERTLTDEEVNGMMKPYYELFEGKGYEIR